MKRTLICLQLRAQGVCQKHKAHSVHGQPLLNNAAVIGLHLVLRLSVIER